MIQREVNTAIVATTQANHQSSQENPEKPEKPSSSSGPPESKKKSLRPLFLVKNKKRHSGNGSDDESPGPKNHTSLGEALAPFLQFQIAKGLYNSHNKRDERRFVLRS